MRYYVIDLETEPYVAAEHCDLDDAWQSDFREDDATRTLVQVREDGPPIILTVEHAAYVEVRFAPELAGAIDAWRRGDDSVYAKHRAIRDAEFEIDRALDEQRQKALDLTPGARDELLRTLMEDGTTAAGEWLDELVMKNLPL